MMQRGLKRITALQWRRMYHNKRQILKAARATFSLTSLSKICFQSAPFSCHPVLGPNLSHFSITRSRTCITTICNALSKRSALHDGDMNKMSPSNVGFKQTEKIENPFPIFAGSIIGQGEGKNDTVSNANVTPTLPVYHPPLDVNANQFDKLPLKCLSCGAFMQTENPHLKGYILPKKLPSLIDNSFEEIICSNCFSLQSKNRALTLGIDRDNVLWQLNHLPKQMALVLYVLDVMDMTGSVCPGLMHLIGENQSVIVVGNKADMLATDDKPRKQEENILGILKRHCINEGLDRKNIKEVCLVSGVTGHGIEKLVVLINRHREVYMDLYIVGSTNVGKSTIFNMLQNLSAVSKGTRIPTQAIAHFTPGSTFGLVRHPIAYWRMKKVRAMLLQKPTEVKTNDEEKEFEFVGDIINEVKGKKKVFDETQINNEVEETTIAKSKSAMAFLDLHAMEKGKRWMYDTPGLMNPQQITQFLTPQELKFLHHRLWIVPKTFILKPGKSLLIGGLARLDYCEISRVSREDSSKKDELPKAAQSVYFTVFCSHNIPFHRTSIEKASGFLDKHFGDHMLKVPFGDPERKAQFPALEPKVYEVAGIGWEKSCVDLSIAGVGWIAITAGSGSVVKLQLHTPNGIGQHLRYQCLMPYSVTKRGERGVRYGARVRKDMYLCTRKDNPQLLSAFERHNEVIKSWIKKIEEKKRYQRFERRTERQRLLLEQGFKGKMRQLVEKVEKVEKEATELKALAAGEDIAH